MTDSPESRTVALSALTAPTSFAALVQMGMARVVDFQKIALDFYAHQTAGVIDSWRKMALPGVSFPGMFVIDAAEKGIADVIAIQKSLLDLMVRQTEKGMAVLRPEIPAAVEDEAAIAAEMVDQIVANLTVNADKPVVRHVAVQQKPKVKRAADAR